MTMHINEVDIRMRVGDAQFGDGADPDRESDRDDSGLSASDREEIILEAVRRTLRMIKASGER